MSTAKCAFRQLLLVGNPAYCLRHRYYEGGVSSVYLWDLDEEASFAGVVLLQKGQSSFSANYPKVTTLIGKTAESPSSATPGKKADRSGSWDSIHVFEATERGRQAHYKLTSTVMLHMSATNERTGQMELGGSLTRQNEYDAPLDPTLPAAHVSNIGRLVEEQELKIRSALQEVYLQKTRNIVNDLRSLQGLDASKARSGLQAELVGALRKS